MGQSPAPAATTPPTPPRRKIWRVMDTALLVLFPFTLVGMLLYLPEWIVAMTSEKRLRKNAKVERGLGGIINAEALELLRPNQPALVIPLAGIAKVHWMLLPKTRSRPEAMYVARVEDRHGNAWLVEDPPEGFTRTLKAKKLVSRFGYGKPMEWAAFALWWLIVGSCAYAWIPWAELEHAWREANNGGHL